MKTKLTLLAIAVISPVIAYGAIVITTPNPVSPVSAADGTAERIPFTNKPVVAGDPESYIGTYGQCPFYENAGEKGCYPPSDITCNADWSYCEPKKESGNNVPSSNTGSTPSQKEQPSGCYSQN